MIGNGFPPLPRVPLQNAFHNLKTRLIAPDLGARKVGIVVYLRNQKIRETLAVPHLLEERLKGILRGKVVGVDGASLVFPVQQQCLMQQKIPIRNPMVMAVPRIPAAAVPFVMVMSSFHAPGGMVTLMLEKLTAVPCTRSGSTIFMQVPSCISVHPFWQSSQELP